MEYLSLEQVMNLANGTLVSHSSDSNTVLLKEDNALIHVDGRVKHFYKQMFTPEWFIVDKN